MIFYGSVVHGGATPKQTDTNHSLSFWSCTCAGASTTKSETRSPHCLSPLATLKDKECLSVATAVTVQGIFCCQSFRKRRVPYLRMKNRAGCTTPNFLRGTPNALSKTLETTSTPSGHLQMDKCQDFSEIWTQGERCRMPRACSFKRALWPLTALSRACGHISSRCYILLRGSLLGCAGCFWSRDPQSLTPQRLRKVLFSLFLHWDFLSDS